MTLYKKTNKNGGRIFWHILKCFSVVQYKTSSKKDKQKWWADLESHIKVFISSAVEDIIRNKTNKQKWWANLLAPIKVFISSAVQDIIQKTNKNGRQICWHILKCLSVVQYKTLYKKRKQTKMAGEFASTY